MAKDTFYFSHDYNSRNDAKIKKLLAKHGYAGYGIFWAIIEDLYNNANALPTDCDTIAFDLRADKKLIESILKDFDLFVFEGDFFSSISVKKRLDERNQKSVKARQSAIKRWSNDANALPMQSEGNAIKERKVKEIKGKENKIITINEVYAYFEENGYTKESAGKFYNYYDVAGWKDSKGNKVKSWKQKAQSVWFKPENEIKKVNENKMVR